MTSTLCVVVWLYTVCVIKNGGGSVSTIAILGTAILSFSAMAWFFSQGSTLYAGLIILAITAAFLVVVWDGNNSNGGWVN